MADNVNGIWKLADVLKTMTASGNGSKVISRVREIDSEGNVLVVPTGSDEAFPVSYTTADVSPGDTVVVTIENGRATIDGSTSAPSISATKANELLRPVAESASIAQSMAASATIAADSAQESATIAAESAGQARDSALSAVEDAEAAAGAAKAASDDAAAANESANEALAGLSVVQDVVGTVNWIAEHAAPTADQEVVAGTNYYSRDAETGAMQHVDSDAVAETYAHTQDTSPVANRKYYELADDSYAPTADTEPDTNKRYYTYSDGSYSEAESIPTSYTATQDTAPVEGKTYYELVTEYGYAATSDTAPIGGKTYYVHDDDGYSPVAEIPYAYSPTSDTAPVAGKTYYERQENFDYEPTEDTEPQSGKTYYVLVDGEYVAVAEPSAEDMADYYELVSTGVSYEPYEPPTVYSLTSDAEPQAGKTYYERVARDVYQKTRDAAPIQGKAYYELIDGSYVEVAEPSADHMADYYERSTSYAYVEVADPSAESMSGYYERSYDMSGAYERSYDMSGLYERTAASTSYVEVAEPVAADMGDYYEMAYDMSGLYELTDAHYVEVVSPVAADMGDYYEAGNPKTQGLYVLDESVRNFLAAHLAMTEDGLYVASSQDDAYRLLAATDGIYIYDADKNLVGKYSDTMQLGSLAGTHMEAAGDYLLFLPKGVTTNGVDMDDPESVKDVLNQAVAYIAIDDKGNSTFYMTRSIVVDDMLFGDGLWKFYRRSNHNMSIKWMGGE